MSFNYKYKREDDKILAGYFDWEDDQQYFWTIDWKEFYRNDDETPMSTTELQSYAAWLEDPWSWIHEHYVIKPNKESAYEDMPKGTPEWKCCYFVIGYEYAETGIFGFGNTEEEALADCKKHYKYIIETYGEQEEE